jgi:hypothetical protein
MKYSIEYFTLFMDRQPSRLPDGVSLLHSLDHRQDFRDMAE